MTNALFDDATRRRLEALMLVAGRVRAGTQKGDRRSARRGSSIEFADYRDYTPGDDLRRLDWNALARLGKPLTKLYEDEEDLAVHVIIDASASMDFPRPGETMAEADAASLEAAHKFTFARRLAAGLAYISLHSNDRLHVTALGGSASGGTGGRFGPARGRGYGARLLAFLNGVQAGGQMRLAATLKQYAGTVKQAALVFIISDLFSDDGWLDGVTALQAKGCEVVLVHTLAEAEITPPLEGDLRLIDSETGAAQEVSLDETLREQYSRRVAAWQDGIRADCARRAIHYVPAITGATWDRVILYDLRRAGIVR